MSEEQATQKIIELAAERLARMMRGIVPDRVYNPDDAAELIGIESERRGKTIREIPRELLPLVSVTPGGRIVGYHGRDLLNYLEDRKKAS
jgi:hypothetical protein